MYKANLHLLEACPCRCRHCFSRFEDGRSLPFEDWVRVIKELRAGGVTDINLAGGEPLLYPHLSALPSGACAEDGTVPSGRDMHDIRPVPASRGQDSPLLA